MMAALVTINRNYPFCKYNTRYKRLREKFLWETYNRKTMP